MLINSFNLLSKMIKSTSLILLQLSIAIAAPQDGFKFFSDLGNLDQIEGSATESKVIPIGKNVQIFDTD